MARQEQVVSQAILPPPDSIQETNWSASRHPRACVPDTRRLAASIENGGSGACAPHGDAAPSPRHIKVNDSSCESCESVRIRGCDHDPFFCARTGGDRSGDLNYVGSYYYPRRRRFPRQPVTGGCGGSCGRGGRGGSCGGSCGLAGSDCLGCLGRLGRWVKVALLRVPGCCRRCGGR